MASARRYYYYLHLQTVSNSMKLPILGQVFTTLRGARMSLPVEFNSSFTPQLPASTLLTERCWLIGLLFLGISYGVLVTLAIFALRLLWKSITPSNRHRKLGWIAIVVFLLFTGTVYPATVTELTVLALSTYRNIEGGPGMCLLKWGEGHRLKTVC